MSSCYAQGTILLHQNHKALQDQLPAFLQYPLQPHGLPCIHILCLSLSLSHTHDASNVVPTQSLCTGYPIAWDALPSYLHMIGSSLCFTSSPYSLCPPPSTPADTCSSWRPCLEVSPGKTPPTSSRGAPDHRLSGGRQCSERVCLQDQTCAPSA